MTALPGQRSAQRPWRAMTASQRVLGRAAQGAAGGLGTTGVAFIDGQTYDVDLSAPLEQQVRQVVPPCRCHDTGVCVCVCVGGIGDITSETDEQERRR